MPLDIEYNHQQTEVAVFASAADIAMTPFSLPVATNNIMEKHLLPAAQGYPYGYPQPQRATPMGAVKSSEPQKPEPKSKVREE